MLTTVFGACWRPSKGGLPTQHVGGRQHADSQTFQRLNQRMIAAVIGIALVLVGCQALQTGVPQMEPPSTDQVEAEQRKLDELSKP